MNRNHLQNSKLGFRKFLAWQGLFWESFLVIPGSCQNWVFTPHRACFPILKLRWIRVESAYLNWMCFKMLIISGVWWGGGCHRFRSTLILYCIHSWTVGWSRPGPSGAQVEWSLLKWVGLFVLGETRPAFHLLGSFRKKLFLKRDGGRLRAVASSRSCCSLHPALPQPLTLILMAPLENLSRPVPISLLQAPASCCPSHPELILDHQGWKIDQWSLRPPPL